MTGLLKIIASIDMVEATVITISDFKNSSLWCKKNFSSTSQLVKLDTPLLLLIETFSDSKAL